ncbi:hypothetical protein [Fictibacillus sp. KU28468]|uniref:AbiTii domain-containing protein n=1 Tax=Fictibacillus sp. KU28468 TaxID=2991053 RepID=UPI00223E8561|nr:hypothetical protein [Fictibacillus sp. KU28468]UZJ78761.1 hypothetical protein OKX00_22060 [Fictibacillus sp. KU28468]
MARSQILKDLVSGSGTLESVLIRLKVILSDLENYEINKWIESEIQGYDNSIELPNYRILQGQAIGMYTLGNPFYRIEHTNSPVPLAHLSKLDIKTILTLYLKDGVSAVLSLIKKEGPKQIKVPSETCQVVSQENLQVYRMTLNFSDNQFQGVISSVKTRLTSIILKLEKEFGNLDSLDVFSNEDDKQKLERIEQYIINVIYDKSITIGDNNKIKSSIIGHGGERHE